MWSVTDSAQIFTKLTATQYIVVDSCCELQPNKMSTVENRGTGLLTPWVQYGFQGTDCHSLAWCGANLYWIWPTKVNMESVGGSSFVPWSEV